MSQTMQSIELAAPAAPTAVGRRRTRNERGMTTAEYAVGTIAAASFAGILIKILTDPSIRTTLLELLLAIFRHFMQIPVA